MLAARFGRKARNANRDRSFYSQNEVENRKYRKGRQENVVRFDSFREIAQILAADAALGRIGVERRICAAREVPNGVVAGAGWQGSAFDVGASLLRPRRVGFVDFDYEDLVAVALGGDRVRFLLRRVDAVLHVGRLGQFAFEAAFRLQN